MIPLSPGMPGPLFTGATPETPAFTFGSVGGRYVVLLFLPDRDEDRNDALEALERARGIFDERAAIAFVVTRRPEPAQRMAERQGFRWFLDYEGEISQLYGALSPEGESRPGWVVLDPNFRVLIVGPPQFGDEVLTRLARQPPPDQHTGVPMHAPILIVPRVLDPDLCRRLVAYYQEVGGQPSGVMREIDGKTVGVLDDFKKRRDAWITDEGLQAGIRGSVRQRLLPEIQKAFQFRATRIERYIVACYGADEGGYFRAHRDNTTAGTAHRKFAVTINLNAEDFEGGDLRFPEYGSRTYRAPTGGAVVFSCALLHEATPVTRGLRYATLPFLYDDEGAAIRERNSHLLLNGGKAPDANADARAS